MDQPYQPPKAHPLDPQEKTPKKDGGTSARLAAGAAWFIAIGMMVFIVRHGSFSNLSGSGFPEMNEDRATFAVMIVAMIAMLLSFTSLKSAARALAFAALLFILPLGSIALYLTAKSAL